MMCWPALNADRARTTPAVNGDKRKPTVRAVLDALKVCASLKDLERGRSIHGALIESGDVSNMFVASTLVNMYAKCGSMSEAREVFDRMEQRDAVTWTSLIVGYANNGEGTTALDVFDKMEEEGCGVDSVALVAALRACSLLAECEDVKDVGGKPVKPRALNAGLRLHRKAANLGLDSHKKVANSLIDMYSRCCLISEARLVFESMQKHDVVSWNMIIFGYAEKGEGYEALHLFDQMVRDGFVPDSVTFLASLKACSNLAETEEANVVAGKLVKKETLEIGVGIHKSAVELRCTRNVKVANALIDMYSKCGSMMDAQKVFDEILPDVVSWTALIAGYADNGDVEKALQLFAFMDHEGCAANSITFIACLRACGALAGEEEPKCLAGKLMRIRSAEKGMLLHNEVAGLELDSERKVTNTLIDMYSRCGCMQAARKVFDGMQNPDVVSWNILILGYAGSGEPLEALSLFQSVDRKGCSLNSLTFVAALKACTSLAETEEAKYVGGKRLKVISLERGVNIHSMAVHRSCETHVRVSCILVDMYAKCGCLIDAHRVFDGINHPDTGAWTALVLGYANNGEAKEALNLFYQMEGEGYLPDPMAFSAAMRACAALGALEAGMELHTKILARGFEQNLLVATSLIDFYGKCWNMDMAKHVFSKLTTKGLVQWTALLAGYSRLGDTEAVFDLFRRMQDEQNTGIDGVVILCILSACGHAGLVDQGKKLFELMPSKYNIEPRIEHYTCMVDMLARAGRLVDALELVRTMPFRPDAATWRTLLSACNKWKDVDMATLAFQSLVSLDNRDAAAYVLMEEHLQLKLTS